jgi:sulfur carrier protein ThiS
MSIQVKVIRMPALVRDVNLPDGSTVADALREAQITADDAEQITVNGNATTYTAVLTDQARVVLARGAKGNK